MNLPVPTSSPATSAESRPLASPAGGSRRPSVEPVNSPSLGLRLFSLALYHVPLVRPVLEHCLHWHEMRLLAFYKDAPTVELIREAYRQNRPYVKPLEAFHLYVVAQAQSRLPGKLAELGVYQGGAAKLICAAKGARPFVGFDTFAGLPPVEEIDRIWGTRFFYTAQYRADREIAAQTLSRFDNVELVPGEFSESCREHDDDRFSFVHLDADLYRSTRAGLEFFWPRLVPGGVLLVHDSHSQGVRTAIQEFLLATGAPHFSSVGSYHLIASRE